MAAKYRQRGIERFGKDFYSRANNYGSPMASAKRSCEYTVEIQI